LAAEAAETNLFYFSNFFPIRQFISNGVYFIFANMIKYTNE
jgi:hypothetical protein